MNKIICGIDEAGRGPLAGPVTAAAVILPDDFEIELLNDSKKLSEKKRNALEILIKEKCIAWSVVHIPHNVIDEINILEATKLCMKNAVEALKITPDFVLTGGNMTLDINIPQKSVIGGDAKSYSIGSASIIAKVFRDKIMDEYAEIYAEYAFDKNKGYGTAAHIKGIKEAGLCPIHRRSFTKKWQ